MINAATTKPPAFDIIVVPSFSYFFRDQFQLEFYIRRLAKNRVRFVSVIQELGGDPMSTTIRQIMALLDEFKHTSLAMKESARHGFRNGSLPPRGYRIVEAAEQPGHGTKNPGAADPPSGTGSRRQLWRDGRQVDCCQAPQPPASLPAMGDAGVTVPSARC
jgi:site-specific DNA recombinase